MSDNVVEDVSTVWLPELSITGADNLVAEGRVKKEINFVAKYTDPLRDDDSELDEGEGHQNRYAVKTQMVGRIRHSITCLTLNASKPVHQNKSSLAGLINLLLVVIVL